MLDSENYDVPDDENENTTTDQSQQGSKSSSGASGADLRERDCVEEGAGSVIGTSGQTLSSSGLPDLENVMLQPPRYGFNNKVRSPWIELERRAGLGCGGGRYAYSEVIKGHA